MTKKSIKAMCAGCHSDFYNHGGGGATECWLLKSARRVEKMKVGTWQNPPYRWTPQETNSCHHPDGSHWVTREDSRVVEDTDEAAQVWHDRVKAETDAFNKRKSGE